MNSGYPNYPRQQQQQHSNVYGPSQTQMQPYAQSNAYQQSFPRGPSQIQMQPYAQSYPYQQSYPYYPQYAYDPWVNRTLPVPVRTGTSLYNGKGGRGGPGGRHIPSDSAGAVIVGLPSAHSATSALEAQAMEVQTLSSAQAMEVQTLSSRKKTQYYTARSTW